jgi:predicted protein tyrosine phosphatase
MRTRHTPVHGDLARGIATHVPIRGHVTRGMIALDCRRGRCRCHEALELSLMSHDEVAPGLFVGSKPAPGRHDCVDAIVLAAIEYQPPADQFPGAEVLHAPLDDDSSRQMREDEIALAVKAAGRVARRLRAGRRVLVTCAMGLNRSALIAALAMHDVFDMKADEIVTRLRRARGAWARSNPNFEKLVRVVDNGVFAPMRSRRATRSPLTSASVQVKFQHGSLDQHKRSRTA